jgi:hypothetical protein
VKTTDSIVDDLHRRIADAAEAGILVEVDNLKQQVIAHQHLARLRVEQADLTQRGETAAAANLNQQIRFWLGYVEDDVDVEQPPAAPAEGVDQLPPPARPKRA